MVDVGQAEIPGWRGEVLRSTPTKAQNNINTDAGLHVVIDEFCKHIYIMTLSVCVCVHIQEASSLLRLYLSRIY